MRLFTAEDTPIIISEDNITRITKFGYSDMHIVSHKPTGRDFGLATLEDAEQFIRLKGWENYRDGFFWRRGMKPKDPKVIPMEEKKDESKKKEA